MQRVHSSCRIPPFLIHFHFLNSLSPLHTWPNCSELRLLHPSKQTNSAQRWTLDSPRSLPVFQVHNRCGDIFHCSFSDEFSQIYLDSFLDSAVPQSTRYLTTTTESEKGLFPQLRNLWGNSNAIWRNKNGPFRILKRSNARDYANSPESPCLVRAVELFLSSPSPSKTWTSPRWVSPQISRSRQSPLPSSRNSIDKTSYSSVVVLEILYTETQLPIKDVYAVLVPERVLGRDLSLERQELARRERLDWGSLQVTFTTTSPVARLSKRIPSIKTQHLARYLEPLPLWAGILERTTPFPNQKGPPNSLLLLPEQQVHILAIQTSGCPEMTYLVQHRFLSSQREKQVASILVRRYLAWSKNPRPSKQVKRP